MSILAHYTELQLTESETISKRLETPLYHITKCIPWIAQKWSEIHYYRLTGNIYVKGETPLEARSSEDVSFEPESSQT